MNPQDLLLRPAGVADLPALERIAASSVHGIGSLPKNPERLLRRLELAEQSFLSEDVASGEESYLFLLEWQGRVIGCSGIAASAGFRERFYSYRNEFMAHASKGLQVNRRMHTLHLCHDLTGSTLLTSFFIEPEFEDTVAPELLSRARLLFIRRFADRFPGARVAAEMPGMSDSQGHSPFWSAVGERFFKMGYPEAERISEGRSRSLIADLMPRTPVYVGLLPPTAQMSIGQLHPVGQLPFEILFREGFEADIYVDVFDAGPTVVAHLDQIGTVRAARSLVTQGAGPGSAVRDEAHGAWHLMVAGDRGRFRACLGRVASDGASLSVDHEAARRLAVHAGDRIDVAPLRLDRGGQEDGDEA
ncbi:arginine N-succinyltransferase [Roseateles terrae]|uniref:Arginine N-succinyltransferase n=1 Tax=Roseateles terrae TaxID=431060 RepID=A0ABR6GW44_9BURK|nr:arginine N-succinyltransferase [Roseateles terrae]MBB3196299.1 arginine N-succinyltransferase [Roseateles terrae]OWQ83947.1 hypothetical protein CDN98_20920 [Roseateles terrae]